MSNNRYRVIHNRTYGKRRSRHRMNVSIPEDVLMQCSDIENFSAFFTTCLERHIKAKELKENEALRIIDNLLRNNRRKKSLSDKSNRDPNFNSYFNPYKRSRQELSLEEEEKLRYLMSVAKYDWVNNDD